MREALLVLSMIHSLLEKLTSQLQSIIDFSTSNNYSESSFHVDWLALGRRVGWESLMGRGSGSRV